MKALLNFTLEVARYNCTFELWEANMGDMRVANCVCSLVLWDFRAWLL